MIINIGFCDLAPPPGFVSTTNQCMKIQNIDEISKSYDVYLFKFGGVGLYGKSFDIFAKYAKKYPEMYNKFLKNKTETKITQASFIKTLALLEYNKSIEWNLSSDFIDCGLLLDFYKPKKEDWDLFNICREFGSGYLFAKKITDNTPFCNTIGKYSYAGICVFDKSTGKLVGCKWISFENSDVIFISDIQSMLPISKNIVIKDNKVILETNWFDLSTIINKILGFIGLGLGVFIFCMFLIFALIVITFPFSLIIIAVVIYVYYYHKYNKKIKELSKKT